jgi:hypothetical protein
MEMGTRDSPQGVLRPVVGIALRGGADGLRGSKRSPVGSVTSGEVNRFLLLGRIVHVNSKTDLFRGKCMLSTLFDRWAVIKSPRNG